MNKNFLIISYGDINYDGRLIELDKLFKNFGSVKTICLSEREQSENDKYVMKYNAKRYLSGGNYIKFIIFCIRSFLKEKKQSRDPVIISDNFYVSPIVFLLKIIYPNTTIIQDCRELYFKEDMPGFGKYLCFFEEKLMKKSNIILCANKYRSNIMKERFNLRKEPLVFDNFRNFEEFTYDNDFLDNKYKDYFKGKWKYINTGGYSLLRRTEDLIRTFGELDNSFELYIVGGGTIEDKEYLEKIIKNLNIQNVFFIGKVTMNELKYLVNRSDIGVVTYGQYNLNNEYCSSGKLFEYIFEELPVITTENVPLKDYVDSHKIGISNNIFKESINDMTNHYELYKNNTINLKKKLGITESNIDTKRELDLFLEGREE